MNLFSSSSASFSLLYSSYSATNHRPWDVPVRRSVWRGAGDCWLTGTAEPQMVRETDCSTTHADHTETENTKRLEQRVRASAPCKCFQDEEFPFVSTTKHCPCATNALPARIISWSVDSTGDLDEGTCIAEVQCKYYHVIEELLPSHNTDNSAPDTPSVWTTADIVRQTSRTAKSTELKTCFET
jgi:hypothetical protein